MLFGIGTAGTAELFGIGTAKTAFIFMGVLASTRFFMRFYAVSEPHRTAGIGTAGTAIKKAGIAHAYNLFNSPGVML